MKAAFLLEHGGPEKIQFGEQPKPVPKADEVLIQVKACALNHLDIWVRQGIPAYPVPFPHILGCDISGEIATIPKTARESLFQEELTVGSEVVVSPGVACHNCSDCIEGYENQCPEFKIIGAGTPGGYAEFVAVPARNLAPKPRHLSFEEAASFPLTFLTAWHMILTRAQLKFGETVLILGAGSGVSTAGIQIAKMFGAKVIAVSSSQDKLDHAKLLGADLCINGSKGPFHKEVRKLTDGRGVDIVFEHVGPATWEESVRSLASRGRIVTCGATTGPIVSLDLRVIFTKDQSIYGSRLGTISEFRKVVEAMRLQKLKPVLSKVFPLSEAAHAHKFLESQSQFGKVVLKISPLN